MREEVRLYIIYLRSGRMLLSKKAYLSWQQIQDEYDDYLTSLGPWTAEEVEEFLREEYPGAAPFTAGQVRAFASGQDLLLEL